MQIHMTVLGVRQYENRFVSTKHAWSGKTLGLSKSKYRHITSEAFVVTCQCFVIPRLLRKCLPWALGHRQGQTLQSAALELGSSWKQTLFYNSAKYEEVQEPVGGGAVDVDHVADAAFFFFSCLLPENHGIGWCGNVNRVNWS